MKLPPVDHGPNMVPKARGLRKDSTKQEKHLWYDFLANHRVRWNRQYPIGHYIVDFYCRKLRIAIELDGSQHSTPAGLVYDAARTSALETYGIQVVRFSNYDVDAHFTRVCNTIDKLVLEKMNQNPSGSTR